jgi:predicted outer membrane protein
MQSTTQRLVSASLLVALAACGRTEAVAPPGRNVSAYDLDFITNLYNVVEFDKEVIGQELARTGDPRVQALARDLLRQANEMSAKVKPIADREGIQPPQVLSFQQRADLHTRIVSIMATSTYDFDQEFLDDEIYSHEDALSRVQQMNQEPVGNSELKSFAGEATGLLQTNLDRLKALKAQLNR